MQPVLKRSALFLTLGLIMVGCGSSSVPVSGTNTVPKINLTYLKSQNQGISLANNSDVFAVANPVFTAKAVPGGNNQITEFQYQIDNGARVDIKNNTAFAVPLTTTGNRELKLFAKDNKGLVSEAFKVNLFVDASPAVINVLAPTEGQVISGNAVKFTVNAEDQDSGVIQILLKNTVGAALCKSSNVAKQVTLDCNVDVSGYSDGLTPFTVEVTNGVGTTTTKTFNAKVQNNPELIPPTVKVTKIDNLLAADAAGKTFSGTVQVYLDAKDTKGIKNVTLMVNGNPVATKTSTPYIFSVNTTEYENGPMEIAAKATNTLDISADATPVAFNVDNVVPPLFSISSPANGQQVTGQKQVSLLVTKQNSNFDVIGDKIKVDVYDFRGTIVSTQEVTGVKDSANGTYTTNPIDFSGLLSDYYDIRAYANVKTFNADGSDAGTQTVNSLVRVTAKVDTQKPPAAVILSPIRINSAQTILPKFVNGLQGRLLVNFTDDKELAAAEIRMTCETCGPDGPVNKSMAQINLSETSAINKIINFSLDGTPYLPNGDYTMRVVTTDKENNANIQELKVGIDRSLINPFVSTLTPKTAGAADKFDPISASYSWISVPDIKDTDEYMFVYYLVTPTGDLFFRQERVLGKVLPDSFEFGFNQAGAWTFGAQLENLTTHEIYTLPEYTVFVKAK